MKIIFIARLEFKYLWDTLSETRESCALKARELLSTEQQARCTVCCYELQQIAGYPL